MFTLIIFNQSHNLSQPSPKYSCCLGAPIKTLIRLLFLQVVMPLLYNSGCKTREYAYVHDIFCPKMNPEGVVGARRLVQKTHLFL